MSNATITLPTTEYLKLREIAQRFETIKGLVQSEPFVQPPIKDPRRVIQEMQNTGKYSKAFLNSLKKGLDESSYFAV